MFFFMLAIFVILASVVVYLITKRGVFSAIGLIVAAALVVLSCVTTVPTGHTGVVTTFGHVENYTLDAGVHMVRPWQQVVKMDNRVQKQTVKLACFSSDIQEVLVNYALNFQIASRDTKTIYSISPEHRRGRQGRDGALHRRGAGRHARRAGQRHRADPVGKAGAV